LGRTTSALGVQPLPEAGEHGHGLLHPPGAPSLGVAAFDLALHGVKLLDEAEGRQRARRIRGLGVEEVAAGMGPARDLDDPPGGVEGVVAGIGIGLQVAAEVPEEGQRSRAAAIGRVVVDDIGRVAIADVHSQPPLPRLGPVAIEDRDHGVVGVNHLAGQDRGLEILVERG
jgi:hypothetical protein